MWEPLGAVNHTATWYAEPTFRGTWGVLSTSLTTIGLCVWTAVHLNIPEQGKADGHIWRKVKWVVIGVFAPEIICFIAFQQWRHHKKLQAVMEEALEAMQPPPPPKRTWREWACGCFSKKAPVADDESLNSRGRPESPRRFRWTRTHSFYGLMGGFVFDTSQSQQDLALPDGKTRMTLSPKGLLCLTRLEPDLLPDMSEETIKDKSKSDGIGKVVAFWQALWFCAQFLSRLAQGLSVSLLELNTFVHCICALIVYFVFWWNKPLDIKEPTLIPVTTPETRLLCAAMCAGSAMGLYPCHVDPSRLPEQLPKARRSRIIWIWRVFGLKAYANVVFQGREHDPGEDDAASDAENGSVLGDAAADDAAADDTGVENESVLGDAASDASAENESDAPAASEEPTAAPPHRGPIPESPSQEVEGRNQKVERQGQAAERQSQDRPPTPIAAVQIVPGQEEEPTAFELVGGQSRFGFSIPKTYVTLLGIPQISRGDSSASPWLSVRVTEKVKRRCRLAEQGLRRREALREGASFDPALWGRFTWTDFVVDRAKNTAMPWAHIDRQLGHAKTRPRTNKLSADDPFLSAVTSAMATFLAFLLASFLYGGIHLLLAWDGPINTPAEVLLWRISCFTLLAPWASVIGLTVVFAVFMLVFLVSWGIVSLCLDKLRLRIRAPKVGLDPADSAAFLLLVGGFVGLVALLLLLAVSLLYLFSRVYVIVECLLSLPFAPASVFTLPNWSAYLMHVS